MIYGKCWGSKFANSAQVQLYSSFLPAHILIHSTNRLRCYLIHTEVVVVLSKIAKGIHFYAGLLLFLDF